MKYLNFVFEVINGVWTILTFFFLAFLTIYLILESCRQRLTWKSWIFGLPLGMAVALALYIQSAGSLATRGVIWFWRHHDKGVPPLSGAESMILFLGSILATAGLLFMIRAFSRSQFGNWPWLSAAAVTAAYVVIEIGMRLWV